MGNANQQNPPKDNCEDVAKINTQNNDPPRISSFFGSYFKIRSKSEYFYHMQITNEIRH